MRDSPQQMPRGKNLENMKLEELIGNTLRHNHLEEMLGKLEKEHTPLEGMDNSRERDPAIFLFKDNQNKKAA